MLNTNVLQTCYSQYFCNVCQLTSEEILSFHFKFKEIVYSNIYVDWIDEKLENYIIWEPFEETLPNNIYDNIINLYNDIIHLLKVNSEDLVKHFAVEAADYCVADYYTEELSENYLYTSNNGDTYYQEDAQDLFNEYLQAFEFIGNNQVEKYETIDMW